MSAMTILLSDLSNSNKKEVFFSADNDLCFDMQVIEWVLENFVTSDEFAIIDACHTGSSPISFTILNKRTNKKYMLLKIRSDNKLVICERDEVPPLTIYNDFWTAYGSFILQNQGVELVHYGYIGGDNYAELFYNNYGLCNDIIASILQDYDIVCKRNYIQEKNMWIDFDEIWTKNEIEIHGVSEQSDLMDISFLVFKAILARNSDDTEFISQLDYNNEVPMQYRVGDPYNQYDDGFFYVRDYTIVGDKVTVQINYVDNLGAPVWDKFIDRLYVLT